MGEDATDDSFDQSVAGASRVCVVVGRVGVSLSPERLRAVRERNGLERRHLAEAVGGHVNEIDAYENGRNRPDPARLKKLADALGVDPLDLLEPGIPVTLAVLRERAGLTQAQAAQRAGMTRSTWAACERGETRIGPARAAQMADALTVEGVVTSAEQVAEAVGQPVRTEYVLPPEILAEVERAQRPGEDLKDTIARVIKAGLRPEK